MDRIDRKILAQLHADGRLSLTELAERVPFEKKIRLLGVRISTLCDPAVVTRQAPAHTSAYVVVLSSQAAIRGQLRPASC